MKAYIQNSYFIMWRNFLLHIKNININIIFNLKKIEQQNCVNCCFFQGALFLFCYVKT